MTIYKYLCPHCSKQSHKSKGVKCTDPTCNCTFQKGGKIKVLMCKKCKNAKKCKAEILAQLKFSHLHKRKFAPEKPDLREKKRIKYTEKEQYKAHCACCNDCAIKDFKRNKNKKFCTFGRSIPDSCNKLQLKHLNKQCSKYKTCHNHSAGQINDKLCNSCYFSLIQQDNLKPISFASKSSIVEFNNINKNSYLKTHQSLNFKSVFPVDIIAKKLSEKPCAICYETSNTIDIICQGEAITIQDICNHCNSVSNITNSPQKIDKFDSMNVLTVY